MSPNDHVTMKIKKLIHIFHAYNIQNILKVFCICVSSSLFILKDNEFTHGLSIDKPITINHDKDPNIKQIKYHDANLVILLMFSLNDNMSLQ